MATIKIAAVGDILMWRKQIQSARFGGTGKYSFDSMFKEVTPYLKAADLTIGNLETTFSGRERNYQKRNPATGYPMFNCPDELASTLKKAGFDMLTTANNHCMDRGIDGLKRTVRILDQHGLAHTGTYRTREDSKKYLVVNKKGIKIGILAYTYGTNYIPVPKDSSWAVNRINDKQMISDLHKLRGQVDLIIVALHFGREFYRYPNKRQQQLVQKLFRNGADIILGAHPHVIQPMAVYRFKQSDGTVKRKFVIYSLGNFISVRMFNNLHSESGVILNLIIKKNEKGETRITDIQYIPTWVHRRNKKTGMTFRVLPIRKFINNPDPYLIAKDLSTMQQVWKNTTSHLKGTAR